MMKRLLISLLLLVSTSVLAKEIVPESKIILSYDCRTLTILRFTGRKVTSPEFNLNCDNMKYEKDGDTFEGKRFVFNRLINGTSKVQAMNSLETECRKLTVQQNESGTNSCAYTKQIYKAEIGSHYITREGIKFASRSTNPLAKDSYERYIDIFATCKDIVETNTLCEKVEKTSKI